MFFVYIECVIQNYCYKNENVIYKLKCILEINVILFKSNISFYFLLKCTKFVQQHAVINLCSAQVFA